jgi:hypothetical protein
MQITFETYWRLQPYKSPTHKGVLELVQREKVVASFECVIGPVNGDGQWWNYGECIPPGLYSFDGPMSDEYRRTELGTHTRIVPLQMGPASKGERTWNYWDAYFALHFGTSSSGCIVLPQSDKSTFLTLFNSIWDAFAPPLLVESST